jgi:Glycine zipper
MTSMTVHGRLLAVSLILLAGCGMGQANNSPAGEATDRPAGSTAAAPRSYTLAVGTEIDAALTTTISSRHAKAGDAFTATVVEDVKSAGGSVAVPLGSPVQGTITEVRPAPNSKSTGTLVLAVTSVTVQGTAYDLHASIDSLKTVSKGRGVEGADVGRTAGGAAAGAIIGQVIGKNTKGTLIGAVIGAGAGAVVSEVMKDVDIVLPAGSHLGLTLQDRLTVTAK